MEQHEAWYNAIRSIVSDRITNEEERMPTTTAMWRHWMRSCWVSKIWQSSTEENPYSELPPPQVCGWIEDENGEYNFDWECAEVQSRITDSACEGSSPYQLKMSAPAEVSKKCSNFRIRQFIKNAILILPQI